MLKTLHPTCKYDVTSTIHTYTIPLTNQQSANSVNVLTIDRNDFAGIEMPANFHPNYAKMTVGSVLNQFLYRVPAKEFKSCVIKEWSREVSKENVMDVTF